jgi:hypothetical protein
MIKFNKYNVSNGSTKARVHYSKATLIDGRECVTLYARDYGHDLAKVMGSEHYQNDTDIMTDYFDKGRVRIFPDSPYYAAASARAGA